MGREKTVSPLHKATRLRVAALFAALALAISCGGGGDSQDMGTEEKEAQKRVEENYGKYPRASFAGGCFWCMEPPFERVSGVVYVHAGYQGGDEENPSYEEVSRGLTGHAEAVEVFYDPEKVSYERLLRVFWTNIDPTDPAGQFADKGSQYRTAIFYHDDEQKRLALESKDELERSGKFSKPVATQIVAAGRFWRAEEYHQNYYEKNPVHYGRYKKGSGREDYLKETWGE
ncbi:MAG: peptide-methionine (S)-S-oxide reductase MsrA [Candidatus Dadabacteria bacterium]|nr:peptide-methionine (S)-S-oxide reductase MsrA [Candidatus Dadabacteria bacterium]